MAQSIRWAEGPGWMRNCQMIYCMPRYYQAGNSVKFTSGYFSFRRNFPKPFKALVRVSHRLESFSLNGQNGGLAWNAPIQKSVESVESGAQCEPHILAIMRMFVSDSRGNGHTTRFKRFVCITAQVFTGVFTGRIARLSDPQPYDLLNWYLQFY